VSKLYTRIAVLDADAKGARDAAAGSFSRANDAEAQLAAALADVDRLRG
jgi:hypothetical protein